MTSDQIAAALPGHIGLNIAAPDAGYVVQIISGYDVAALDAQWPALQAAFDADDNLHPPTVHTVIKDFVEANRDQ